MHTAVEELFGDSKFREFINELFEEDEPIMEIARQHRDSFAALYGECKQQKNSSMQFQLQYQYHCSAYLLEEKYTLAAIKLDESTCATLVAARKTWLEFCKNCNFPVPGSNPVIMAISSRAYSYLLDQVSIYQASLTDQTHSDTAESLPVGEDGDDVYYRFGGAAICAMLKIRYKEMKNCLRTDRNGISIQICMLQAMNLKDKSCIPDYLKYRDRGYMYFPHGSLIPFFCALDTVVKKSVNEEGFCKHGDGLIQVAHTELKAATNLKQQFTESLKLLLPNVTLDAESEDAITVIYDELTRKLCNTRIQEFLSSTKQNLAAKKGLASTVDVNLRTKLLTNHTQVSTIRQQ
ncbi:uncharacterized protein [Dysidea avara]|uniref:uncharacterized protein n=1 Tax=Dysidea avara TaxID=196820 RepID=UPI003323D47D